MSASEITILVLAVALWGSIYWPVYLTMRLILIGTTNAETKSSLFAMFWPITVPVGWLVLLVLGVVKTWRRR